MYSTLENLGITPIRCENKATDEEVKEIHYSVNDILYRYRFCLISGPMAKYIARKLEGYRNGLRGLWSKEKGQIRAKVSELGKTLSTYINKLNDYNPQDSEDDNARVLRKRVAEYVKVKDELDFEGSLKFARENWILDRKYSALVPSFKQMQRELIESLNNYIGKLSLDNSSDK